MAIIIPSVTFSLFKEEGSEEISESLFPFIPLETVLFICFFCFIPIPQIIQYFMRQNYKTNGELRIDS
jgi:hypothetical protein